MGGGTGVGFKLRYGWRDRGGNDLIVLLSFVLSCLLSLFISD